MSQISYYAPHGGLPAQTELLTDRAVVTEAYTVIPKGVYPLNRDWVEVEAGDFMWLRAFCPQACYAGGPDNFRYLLYKDVNRHPTF